MEDARALLLEYTESLGVDLSFQNFDRELAAFPESYLPPTGALLLCFRDESLAGSVAMRGLDDGVCEMKRLYVRPAFRGRGVGRELAVAVIEAGRGAGYRSMRLETMPSVSIVFLDSAKLALTMKIPCLGRSIWSWI